MTPRQLDYLYYRPRDKKTGSPKSLPYLFNRETQNRLEQKINFINMGLAFGQKVEELERQWKEQMGDESDGDDG